MAVFKIDTVSIGLDFKLGRITRPHLAIRQKLAASENIRVERLLLVTFQTSFYGNFDFLDN